MKLNTMKRFLLQAILAFFLMPLVQAQIEDPVSWSFSHENKGGLEAELVFKASIDMPWHLYSALLPEGGPIATKPYYEESEDYSLSGEIVEVTKAKQKYDEGFKMELGTISGRAELRQKVSFAKAGTYTIKGEIEYQVCDDATCLPPKNEPFSFTINVGQSDAAGEASTETTAPATVATPPTETAAPAETVFTVSLQTKWQEYLPSKMRSPCGDFSGWLSDLDCWLFLRPVYSP